MRIWTTAVWILLSAALSAQTKVGAEQAPAPPQGAEQAASSGSTQPKLDPAKEADIRRFMDVSGSSALASQQMQAVQQTMKPIMTSALPAGDYRTELVDLFFAKFQAKADTQKLLDLMVPIYDKYLTDAEIKGLIQFYQTPLGQKALQVLPKLMEEAQEEGRKWGQNLGQESMREVLSEHPELAKALEDAQKAAQPH